MASSHANLLEQKEYVYIRKEFNSHNIGVEHQRGRCFIVWHTSMVAVESYGNTITF